MRYRPKCRSTLSTATRFVAVACIALAAHGAEVSDGRLAASIESLILPNDDAAWVCDAAWDEYVIRVRALSEGPLEIREVVLFDALGERIDALTEAGALRNGSYENQRRYAQFVRSTRAAGVDGRVIAGAAVAGLAAAALATQVPAAPRAMRGVGPALIGLAIVGSVAQHVKDRETDAGIQRRATTLPMTVAPGEGASLDLFFPRSLPSGRARIVYTDRDGEHRLEVESRAALAMHAAKAPPSLLHRMEPRFPVEARRAGISGGFVKAQLRLDREGRVQEVDVVDAYPRRVFDDEAGRALRGFAYDAASNDCRRVEATLEFRR
jgi:TonB family protein